MTRASKPLLKLSEKQVTEQCIGWLRSQGYFCIRLNSGLLKTPDGRTIRIGEKNIPDWAVLKGHEYWLMEFKATGKAPSADQFQFCSDMRKRGFRVMWADGLDAMRGNMA